MLKSYKYKVKKNLLNVVRIPNKNTVSGYYKYLLSIDINMYVYVNKTKVHDFLLK